MRIGTILLVLVCSAIGWSAPAGSERGLPFVRYYTPKTYSAQGQNWAIAQDRRGIVFFANNDGVLEYDGVSWRVISVATGSVVRSLAIDDSGRVWVGARGEFGFLEPDDKGQLRYRSLLDRLPADERKVQDVWSTIVTGNGVYFSSFTRVYSVSPSGDITVIRPENNVTRLFSAGSASSQKVYAHQAGRGLTEFDGRTFTAVPGGEVFADGRVACLLPGPGGSLRVFTRDAIYLQDGQRFQKWANEAAEQLSAAQVYGCAQLLNGSMALATLRRGVFILSSDGRLEQHLNKESGIPREVVAAVMQDREGGLWLGTDSGIVRVESPSPLTFFDDRSGLKDTVVAITRHEGRVYVATLTGLFRLVPGVLGLPATFEAMPSTPAQTYGLLSTEAGLLVGGTGGVAQIKGGVTRQVAKRDTVFDLYRSRRDPSTAYAMGPGGLTILRLANGVWSDQGGVPGVRQVLRRCAEDEAGRLWFGTDLQGVLRLDPRQSPLMVETFGAGAGLPEGWTYPFRADGRIVVTSRNGILQFDETRRAFVPDDRFGIAFAGLAEQPLLLAETASGEIWVGAKTYSGVLRKLDRGFSFDPVPLRRAGLSEIYAFYPDADGSIWVGSAEGIARFDPRIPKPSPELPVNLRLVSSLRDGSTLLGGFGTESRTLTLPFHNNALRFQFAAPSFDDESATEYRFSLDGADHSPTAWAKEPRKDFTNIPEGSYRLQVEARNINGISGKLSAFEFEILPPWYRTRWAYLLYLIAGAALVWGLIQWRLHQLSEQNRLLQQLVDQRTEEIRHKQIELEQTNGRLASANEELTRYNDEKNEFMGIAAHDLKNPLGAIRGYAEMLEEDASDLEPEDIRDSGSKIKRSANLMLALVTNLLDVNRIERGLVKSEIAPVDLAELARRATENYRDRAEAKNITLVFESDPKVPLALADESQLSQVLDNLISNAVKYSPLGKSIFVSVKEADNAIRFRVQDQGPGITAEDRKRLFINFARLSAKPTAGEHSTGLGLAIVKRLTEQMNGKVWCESEPGQGAAFIVELPLAKSAVGIAR